LTQWRGYTTPGDAYALIFDGERLLNMANRADWTLQPCKYWNTDGVEGAVVGFLGRAFSAYLGGEYPSAEAATDALMNDLLPAVPLIKDDAFRHEREWRLVSPIVDPFQQPFEYRPGRSYLIPYLQFPLSEPRPLADIKVGPGPQADLAHDAVGLLITHRQLGCGYTRSIIPYRAW
jgi:hypothetical protein